MSLLLNLSRKEELGIHSGMGLERVVRRRDVMQ